MHILIIPFSHFQTERYPAGGIFQLAQATALRAAGHKIGVISPDVISPRFLFRSYRYRDHEVINGIEVFRHYERTLKVQRFVSAASAAASHQAMGLRLYEEYVRRNGRPDIVHAHNVMPAAAVAKAIRDRDGVPYIITEHSSIYAYDDLEEDVLGNSRDLAAGASTLTAVSTFLAERVKQRLNLVGREVHVLPNVLGTFFADKKMQPWPKPCGQTFLSVGSLDANKNHELLIEAFAQRYRGTAATLRIAGTGPLRRHLENTKRRLGVERQVTLLGFLDRPTLWREVSFANCFVLSSFVETFGVVLIESLACGVPVVATRCGGAEDVVNETNGVLVPPGRAEELGAAMAQVLEAAGQYDPERLREDCLRRFGPAAFVVAAMREYERAGAHSEANN